MGEKEKAYQRRYYLKNKAAGRLRYHTDKIYRAKLLATNSKRYASLREQMLDEYGRRCACCGESGHAFLTMDHGGVDKGLRLQIGFTKKGTPLKIAARGTAEYLRLKKFGWPKDVGIRILCMNCNWASRRGMTCPHQSGQMPPDQVSALPVVDAGGAGE